jgi:hypothetical protein
VLLPSLFPPVISLTTASRLEIGSFPLVKQKEAKLPAVKQLE